MNEQVYLRAPNDVPYLDKYGKSESYLVLVRTPSTRYWAIGHFDHAYRATQPWRTYVNHPIDAIGYMDLPEIPNEF